MLTRTSNGAFYCSRYIGDYQIYGVLDDTTAQLVPAIESGDSIRRVAHHLYTP